MAYLKHRLACQTQLNIESLPVNPEFLQFLKQEKKKERRIDLFTAANEEIANKINRHYKIFDTVHASTPYNNFGPKAKLVELENMGITKFDYAGDRKADIKIFQIADKSIIVNPSLYLKNKLSSLKPSKVFDRIDHLVVYGKALLNSGWQWNLLIILVGLTYDASNYFVLLTVFYTFFATDVVKTLFRSLIYAQEDRVKGNISRNYVASGVLSIVDAVVFMVIFIGIVVSQLTLLGLPLLTYILIDLVLFSVTLSGLIGKKWLSVCLSAIVRVVATLTII